MHTPQEQAALEAFRDAGAEVARVSDDHSPWGTAAAEITRQVRHTLEDESGEYVIEIDPRHRARLDEAVGFLVAMYEEEPRDDHRSPEERNFLHSLYGGVQTTQEAETVVVSVASVAGQRMLAHVLQICVSEAIRVISHEPKVDAQARRREFDEQVEEVDHWFALLGRVEPREEAAR